MPAGCLDYLGQEIVGFKMLNSVYWEKARQFVGGPCPVAMFLAQIAHKLPEPDAGTPYELQSKCLKGG